MPAMISTSTFMAHNSEYVTVYDLTSLSNLHLKTRRQQLNKSISFLLFNLWIIGFGSDSLFIILQLRKTYMKIVSKETIFLHKTFPKLPSYIPLDIIFAQTMVEHHGSSGGTWT